MTSATRSGALFINPIRDVSGDFSDFSGTRLVYNASSRQVGYVAKSFIIDHPLDSKKYLIHACIEGPENGLYYRGVGCASELLSEGYYKTYIRLPEYTNGFARDYTVDVTPIYNDKYENAYLAKRKQFRK